MHKHAVIGITGRARSGKDTVAEMILADIGGYRYSLADPIRAMLKAGLGIDMADSYWIEHKEDPVPAFGGKSPRQMLQWLGTEWGRDLVDRNLWVTLAIQKLINSGRGMIVPDVRFENEGSWVRRHGILIHVVRRAVSAVAAHVSEDGVTIEPADYIIANDGSLEDLQLAVREILSGRAETGKPVRLGSAQVSERRVLREDEQPL